MSSAKCLPFKVKCVNMMTSSNGNIFRVTGPFVGGIHRSPVISPHKGQWRGALMFSLICVWMNGWVNNREADDLRRHRAHYEVIVMSTSPYYIPAIIHTVRALLCLVGASDWPRSVNTLRPKQNGSHFPDDSLKCIFLNENIWISIEISLTFVPKGPINSIPALVRIMAWHRPGTWPLSEPMTVRLRTHICITRPQWVKTF